MNIERRVARLRIAHGESLRKAAVRTGVSHSTIARIEKGEVTTCFDETLRKIADGYQVPLDYLLTGRHPNQANPTAVLRQITPEERASLLFTPGRERLRLAVSMVTRKKPGRLSRQRFAAALGLNPATLGTALRGGADLPETLPEQLALLTGLSPLWFHWSLAEDQAKNDSRTEWAAYMRLVEKVSQAELHPELVEMAIDLLRIKENSQTEQVATF